MKISFKSHIESIKSLQGRLADKTHPTTTLLFKQLDALEISLIKSRSKERAIATQVLSDLNAKVDQAGLEAPDAELLHKRIDQLQEAILLTNASKLKSPIPTKLAVFLGSDHNSAITEMVSYNLSKRIPFIVSFPILSFSDLNNEQDRAMFRNKFRKNFMVNRYSNGAPDWQIYLQVDKKYGDQFLVCLPKEIKLEDLDLIPAAESGTKLVPITYKEVLQGPHDPYRFEAIMPLLSGQASHDKLISLHAHGSVGTFMSLDQKQTHDLMHSLENQRCRAAAFTSCYVGGKSTLQLLSEQSDMHAPPFPVIVRSIGDYSVLTNQSDMHLLDFFRELEVVMRQSGGETVPSFDKPL